MLSLHALLFCPILPHLFPSLPSSIPSRAGHPSVPSSSRQHFFFLASSSSLPGVFWHLCQRQGPLPFVWPRQRATLNATTVNTRVIITSGLPRSQHIPARVHGEMSLRSINKAQQRLAARAVGLVTNAVSPPRCRQQRCGDVTNLLVEMSLQPLCRPGGSCLVPDVDPALPRPVPLNTCGRLPRRDNRASLRCMVT